MKKLFSILGSLIFASSLYAGTIVKPNTFVSGTIIDPSQVNSNFDTIYNEFNGSIENINIDAAAAIVASKLSLTTIAEAITITTADDTVLTLNNSSGGRPIFVALNNGTTVLAILNGGQTQITALSGSNIPLTIDNGSSTGSIFTIKDAGNTVIDVEDGGLFVLTRSSIAANVGPINVPSYTFNGDKNTGYTSNSADTLNVVTAGVEAITVDSSQNIGISSTTPNAVLTVVEGSTDRLVDFLYGNASVFTITNGGNTLIQTQSGGSNTPLTVNNRTATGFILDAQDNGFSVLVVDDGGNVGIGTTTPSALLHVVSGAANAIAPNGNANEAIFQANGNTGISFLSANTATQAIFFGDEDDNDVGQIEYIHTDNFLQFTTNGTNISRIESDGDFNIQVVGDADVELEVSNGSVTGGGTIHRAASATHSSKSIKSEHNYLNVTALQNQAIVDIRSYKPATFKYKVRSSTAIGQLVPDSKQPTLKGYFYEDMPNRVVNTDHKTIILDNRVMTLEMAVQYLINKVEDLQSQIDANHP